VAGSCEHGNEPSGSIKCGEFLKEILSVHSTSQEGLCSMELVSFLVMTNLRTSGHGTRFEPASF
jgi:hypothetical protein